MNDDQTNSRRSRSKRGAPGSPNEPALAEMLALIRAHPGIRPSELNRQLSIAQSDALRATLIRRGLVLKVREGTATFLYPIDTRPAS